MQIQFLQRAIKGDRECQEGQTEAGVWEISNNLAHYVEKEWKKWIEYEYEITEHNVGADDRLKGSKRKERKHSLASLNAFTMKENPV